MNSTVNVAANVLRHVTNIRMNQNHYAHADALKVASVNQDLYVMAENVFQGVYVVSQ